MCAPPCGPRRSYVKSSLAGKYNPRTRANAESFLLMNAETAKCYVKKEDGSGYRKYRGRLINILNLIRDEYTHAKVVQKGSKEYTSLKRIFSASIIASTLSTCPTIT